MVIVRLAVPADAAAVAHIHVDSWRTTYAGIVPDEHLARLNPSDRELMWRQMLTNPEARSILLVAEDTDRRVVGFACGGPSREAPPEYDAELFAIYLLEAAQRSGTGRALMRAMAGRLVERGYTGWLIWVLADNPARGFYERMGGQYVMEKDIEIGGAVLREIAYGWPDLRLLVEETPSAHEPG